MTVKQKQCLLYCLGYDPGVIDGIDGKNTQAAMEKFRADYGVGEDGLVGALAGTVPKMESPQPAKTGDGTWWDDIRYFARKEFRCTCPRCGGFPVEPTEALVKSCDKLREAAGESLLIVDAGGSGVRCAVHNAEVGGVANSNHIFGKAADLHPTRMSAKALYDLADKQLGKSGELGLYSWGIHFAPEGKYSRFRG